MNINDIDWADSRLESINIEYDKSELRIVSESGRYVVTCAGLIGLTNLCIWDDTIIDNITVFEAGPSSDAYLQQVYSVYDKSFDYGGRILGEPVLVLSVSIINNTTFNLYCKSITVSLQ